MKTEIERIQEQLRRAFEGEAWHGPSLLELLADLNAADAASRPIKNGHSIWELVLHIAAWNRAVANRLRGGLGEVKDDENFPVITDTSEAAWQLALDTLKASQHELSDAMGAIEETRLDQPIVAEMSSVYVQLHGAIQHGLYHAGQVAILKRALER